MTLAFESRAARQALANLPQLQAQESLDPPALARVYVPALHVKALSLDNSIVVGMRGAGKSWWTAVLASDPHREFVSAQLPSSSLGRVRACVGFGLDDTETSFPRPDTLTELLGQGRAPIDIWQTVVLRHALATLKHPLPFPERRWKEAVGWFLDHREEANDLLTRCDEQLAREGRVLLVLFDAFDRLARVWTEIRELARGALEAGLRLRSRRSIRVKFFLRPDLDEDGELWRFPDSSKFQPTKVSLAWGSSDLYGLVIMHLSNDGDFGPTFRKLVAGELKVQWRETKGVYLPPQQLTTDDKQKLLLEALADRTMGAGPKRGYTFSWIPLHLSDAKGRVSPRSFLLAFQKAAEHTEQHRPHHHLALHYDSIQRGVIKASEVRVAEIGEDYPWVRPLLESLRGVVVPLTVEEVKTRWSAECVDEMLRMGKEKLPPRRYADDPFRAGTPEALVDDLVELGVVYRTGDGRLNMPDIFRVGYGIRRKGGVKPPR